MVDATAHSDAAPTGGPADSPERSAVGASPVGRPDPRIATRARVCISSRCRRCRRNKQLRHRSPMAEPLRWALLRRLLVFAEPATQSDDQRTASDLPKLDLHAKPAAASFSGRSCSVPCHVGRQPRGRIPVSLIGNALLFRHEFYGTG